MKDVGVVLRGASSRGLGRRRLLKVGGAVGLALLVRPSLGLAAVPQNRSLSFRNLHTGERLTVDYCVNGCYEADALEEVNQVLRDHRTGDIYPIDIGLLDIVHTLRNQLGSRADCQVISGYRSPKSNAMLAGRSRGVARKSFHMQGRALDFYLPDRQLRDLRQASLAMRAGGTGYYPGSGFVHVDTGPVRSW